MVACGEIPQLLTEYPTDLVRQSTPRYIRDSIPNLGVRGAKYLFEADEGEIYITYFLSDETAAFSAKLDLKSMLIHNDFFELEEDILVSSHDQVHIMFNQEGNMLYVCITFSEENNVYECRYELIFQDSWVFNDEAQVYVWVWGGEYEEGTWFELVTEEDEEGNVHYCVYLSSTATNMILVRFSSDSIIDWPSEENDEVVIWNRTHPEFSDGYQLSSLVVDTIRVAFGNSEGN